VNPLDRVSVISILGVAIPCSTMFIRDILTIVGSKS
jgi:hypothetical protein